MAKIIQIPINSPQIDREPLEEVLSILKSGGVIGFPTDTYYGLGANPSNAQAVENIFKVKNRSVDKPILILVSSRKQVESVAEGIDLETYNLMNALWPGPLTLVLKAKSHLPRALTAGTGTIGVRLPDHLFTHRLIEATQHPLTAPSANLSGQNNPTTAREVEQALGNRIPLIIDSGPTPGGKASTVLDLHQSPPRLLRRGQVSLEQIEAVLKKSIHEFC